MNDFRQLLRNQTTKGNANQNNLISQVNLLKQSSGVMSNGLPTIGPYPMNMLQGKFSQTEVLKNPLVGTQSADAVDHSFYVYRLLFIV